MSGVELVVAFYLNGVAVAFIGYICLVALPKMHGGYVTTSSDALLCAIFAVLSWIGAIALTLHGVLSLFQEIRQIWVEKRGK